MKKIVVLSLVLLTASPVFAKEIIVPKGNKNPSQLHQEILSQFPQWAGTLTPQGTYRDPALSLGIKGDSLILNVPDTANENLLQSVIAAHQPAVVWPPVSLEKQKAQKKIEAIGLTEDDVKALIQ